MKLRRQHFGLGRVLTVLVALCFTADMSLRMLPFEVWRFNPHPMLVELRESGGPFEPAAKYEEVIREGDIAGLANLPPLEPRRVGIFETDRWGFRNPPDFSSGGDVDAILVGDSFSYTGDTYDESLAAAISKTGGLRVYNAARPFSNDIGRILGIAQQLGMKRGVVIFEILERDDVPAIQDVKPQPSVPADSGFLARHSLDWLEPVDRHLRLAANVSPVEIFSERLYLRLRNDVILPNPRAGAGVVAKLANGETMYFYERDVHPVRSPAQNWARYIKWLASVLREHNLDLVVFLVPNKYSVYGPLVAGHIALGESESSYMDSVASELEAQHIVTVNLSPPLRAAAAERLENHSYVYWRDDTHWNTDGVKLAAEKICEQLGTARSSR